MAVTVIIPNHNNERFITTCLNSVRCDQAVSEIIIYDNASTDGSVAIIEQLAEPKVTLVRGALNIGAARARHAAVQRSKTKYIYFLDGDDYLAAGTVTSGHRAAETNLLDLAIPEMVRVTTDTEEMSSFVPRPAELLDGRTAFMMTVGGWRIHPMGVMRRKTYSRALAQFEFHGFSDDELLTRHLLLAADRVGGCDGTYFYRVVQKPQTPGKLVGQLRTQLRVLELASHLEDAALQPVLRENRNAAVRTLFGLLLRTTTGRAEMKDVRQLAAILNNIASPWSVSDLPYRTAAQIIALCTRLAT